MPVSPYSPPEISIVADSSARTLELQVQTGFALIESAQREQVPFYLNWENEQLTLHDCSTPQKTRISVDFVNGKNRHRRKHGGGFGQPLARAINASTKQPLHVCDATGGLGHDAFVFATLGCQVTLLEKSAVVYALLHDAWQRALSDPDTTEIAQRMSIYNLDSTTLPDCWPSDARPSVVYLDPMYPDTTKTAAAKKGMQILQRILPSPNDTSLLLPAAISTATSRVTVKRPRHAPSLTGATPVGTINSPNTRYDIYKGFG